MYRSLGRGGLRYTRLWDVALSLEAALLVLLMLECWERARLLYESPSPGMRRRYSISADVMAGV